jgi:hypothetical protein
MLFVCLFRRQAAKGSFLAVQSGRGGVRDLRDALVAQPHRLFVCLFDALLPVAATGHSSISQSNQRLSAWSAARQPAVGPFTSYNSQYEQVWLNCLLVYVAFSVSHF